MRFNQFRHCSCTVVNNLSFSLVDPDSPEGSKWERNIPPPPHVSILYELIYIIFNALIVLPVWVVSKRPIIEVHVIILLLLLLLLLLLIIIIM